MVKKSSEAIRDIKVKEELKAKAKANKAPKAIVKASQTVHLRMFLKRWGISKASNGSPRPRVQSTYHLQASDPYEISPRTQRHINYLCDNPTSWRITQGIRPPEKIIAANTKLVALCGQPHPHLPDISKFMITNQLYIFPGYGEGARYGRGAAIRALEADKPPDPSDPDSHMFRRGIIQARIKRCPRAHDYLTRELDVDMKIQLKRLVLINYSDTVSTLMQHYSHFDAVVAIKTMTEKEFMKLVVCVGTIGDTKLALRLLKERKRAQALTIGSLVVGLLTAGYRRNIELFALFLYLFVGKVRLEPELKHYSRYVLMHAAKIGDKSIFVLTLKSIDFDWFADTNVKTQIELDETTTVPKYILPHVVELCAKSQSSDMLDVIVPYLKDRVKEFGPEYRFAIIEACRNRHTSAAQFLLLGYTMTAEEAQILLRLTDDIEGCDTLVEAIMMAYMTYSNSSNSDTDEEDVLVIDDEVIDEGCIDSDTSPDSHSSPSEWFSVPSPTDHTGPNPTRAPYLLEDYGSDLTIEPLGLMA